MEDEDLGTEKAYEPVDTVTGDKLQVVRAALPELVRRGLDASAYKVMVTRDESSIFVTFIDLKSPEGMRGAGGQRPGFEVELDAEKRTVLRGYYLR